MNSHISVSQPAAFHRAAASCRPRQSRIPAGRLPRRNPHQPLCGQQPPRADDTGDEQVAAAPCCGNLLQTQDPSGNQVFLGYDLRGRKTQMQDPDMGTWTYAYDALGQLIRQIDAKAQTSLMYYDKLGRMVYRGEADLISHWYYDSYKGGGACAKGIGKLCQAETDHNYNKTVSYDSQGRFSSASTTIDTVYGDSATYDANGRLLTRTYPTGIAAKYVYTSLGYLKEVRNNATNALYWTANSLDAAGHLLQQTYGNNVVTQQSYNAANGSITGITAGAGNGVQNLTYTYDNLGNITIRTDANQNLTESFTYDTLNRLQTGTVSATAVSPAVTTTYGYNAIGNLLGRTHPDYTTSQSYPASGSSSVRPHALSRVDFSASKPEMGICFQAGNYTTYGYDANGNLAGATQYNASNQQITGCGRTALFTSFNMPNVIYNDATSSVRLELSQYGPEHQRLTSTVVKPDPQNPAVTITRTTVYLNPDNAGSLFYEKETKASGVIEQRNYITAYGQAVAIVKLTGSTWSTIYLHRDNLGSTTAITDASGAVIERLAYEPFGNRRFANGVTDPNNAIVAVNTNRGFTNHEHFDELDLVHMNGRIYDPITGRFMSADPNIQMPGNLQSYNRYSYAVNNPLMYIDPTGYSLWTKFRDQMIRVAAAYLDYQTGCTGCFSSAVGAYQGYRDGGPVGAITGGVSGYFGSAYPLEAGGTINWTNVIMVASVNAGAGCINASAAGGSCERGALAGATGTVGAAYGFMGAVIAGCAGGRISGGSCRDGAIDAVGTYAVSKAASGAFNYILDAAKPPSPPPSASEGGGLDLSKGVKVACNGDACGAETLGIGGEKEYGYKLKAGVPPPSNDIDRLLDCTANCAKVNLRVTSTSDSHGPDNPHTRGLAVDLTTNSPETVMQCAANCGAVYQQNEYSNPSPRSNGGHLHFQLLPGRGGKTGPYYPKDEG